MTRRTTTIDPSESLSNPTLPAAGNFQPRQSCYLVARTDSEAESAGGIFIPETARAETNEGTVLVVGPGYAIPTDSGGCFSTMWADEGDTVVFPSHCFETVEGNRGIVHDEDLLGVIPAGSDMLFPLNDFVMVAVSNRRDTTEGGVHLADTQRSRPRRGEILDYGPGKMRMRGSYYGTRVSVEQILGVTLPSDKGLRGRVVIWGADAEVLEVGSEKAEFLLVRASDILAFDESEENGP